MYCDWPVLLRCCFCMPLRRGILTFAYINIIFNVCMIVLYSCLIHHNQDTDVPYYSAWVRLPSQLTLAMFCIEFLFSCLLIYGAHKKSIFFLKTYYYFAITTMVAAVLLEIVAETFSADGIFVYIIELALFSFIGLCVQLYLITLIRSLLKKLEVSGPHVFENQLQQFVSGETKIESNGIYNDSTVVPVDV